MSRPSLVDPLAALAIGILNTTGIPAMMCLSVVVPALGGLQRTRRRALFAIGAYYLGCAWPVFFVMRNYAGALRALLLAPIVCVVGVGLLTSPFVLAWSPHPRLTALRLPLSVILGALPPLGIIGIGSPLAVSGLLFPGAKWMGILLILALPSMLLISPKSTVAAVVLISACLNARSGNAVPPPVGWAGVNTKTECAHPTVECEFRSFAAVKNLAVRSAKEVLVFPEAAVQKLE